MIRSRHAGPPIRLAFCWAQARRKRHKVAKNSTAPIAQEGQKRIADPDKIEAAIRGRTFDECVAMGQQRSAPTITAFEVWLADHRARVSSKSPLGEALKYIARSWNGLCLFLPDGRVEMDSNAPSHRYFI